MSRIRTIKPEFWTDPFMVSISPFGRLMFMALISSADDHGYISDEPERIALEVMPREDPLDVDDWIQLFQAAGKLDIYASDDGETYLHIKNWDRHQRVDKPGKSKIAREDSRKFAIPTETRRQVASKYGCAPGEEIEAKCYYCECPGKVHWHRLRDGRPSAWVTFPGLELDHLECEHDGGKNDSGNIVLACRNCNRTKGTTVWFEFIAVAHKTSKFAKAREDSRNLPDGTGNREQGTGNREGKGTGKSNPDGLLVGVKPPTCPHQQIIELYHDLLPMCPRVQQWTDQRKAMLKTRWCESAERQSLDWWQEFFTYVAQSNFLTGHSAPRGDVPPFLVDLEWLVRPKNFVKVLEGRYENRKSA